MTRLVDKKKTAELLADCSTPNERQRKSVQLVRDKYAVAITPAIQALIDAEDASAGGPISAQFLPSEHELIDNPGDLNDPIGDRDHSPVPGIVHRYPDRVLFKIVATCPAYCRFCFRRAMIGPGSDDRLSQTDIDKAVAYIASRPKIWEVIFSGGDPLILSPRKITAILHQLEDIKHVKVIRWHTRVPIVSPEMITDDLVTALTQTSKASFVAIHSNHASEHTKDVRHAIRALIGAGITVLSQTVLLRNVNDSIEDLSALMRSFVEMGVKPYYLHQLDKAPGTSHFKVPLVEARELVSQLRGQLSGLCQPTFMLDIPGGHGKVVASREELKPLDAQTFATQDFQGKRHIYLDDQ